MLEEEIYATAGRRGRKGGEAREGFELEGVVSCCSGDQWWRTKLDLGSGEPLDNLHWSSTLGTAIKIRGVFGGGSVFLGEGFWGCAQQLQTKRQKLSAPTVGQKAEMSDAHEALGK